MPATEHTQDLTAATADAPSQGKVVALLSGLARSRAVLIATIAVVVLAVAGASYGYTALSNTVTLSVDGKEKEVRVLGNTVADVLEAEGIKLTERDQVQPAVNSKIGDDSVVAVRFARPVELTVDGATSTHWVTATSVNGALQQIGSFYRNARLSTSRGASIDRSGIELSVVTPKTLTVVLAGAKAKKVKVPATTVAGALRELDVELDKHDRTFPARTKPIRDGQKVTYVDFEVETKRVKREPYEADTETRENDDELEGTETVIREGKSGVRDVTYRIVYRNGERIEQKIVTQRVVEKAVPKVIEVGTKEEPSTNYASGSTVWDRLAQCESGGNWAANTGNGYYGGVQFSASTWHAVGGTGLPHQHSREEQIKRASILQAQAGWGQWPHCSAQLGLR